MESANTSAHCTSDTTRVDDTLQGGVDDVVSVAEGSFKESGLS